MPRNVEASIERLNRAVEDLAILVGGRREIWKLARNVDPAVAAAGQRLASAVADVQAERESRADH